MGYISSYLKSLAGDEKPQQAQQQAQQQQSAAITPSQPQLQPHATTSGTAPISANTVASTTPSPPSTPSIPSEQSAVAQSIDTGTLYQNPRARTIKQLSLYAAGATFFTASVIITRRAVLRKLITTKPKFYTPSNHKATDANGAVEAAEALALATLNVGSFALMMTGGTMFALDVVNAEDLRAKYKRRMGFGDNFEQTADAEIEEWVRGVLEKKDGGDYKGVAEGLTALVGVLAGKEEDKEKLMRMQEEMKSGATKEAVEGDAK